MNKEIINNIELYNADCFDVMPMIADKSIDCIIADLPYGTTSCKWDSILPFDKLWEQYKRIIKDNGAIILFGSQPFTSALVMSNPKMFRYELVWDKKNPTNFASANKCPLKSHENILVFYLRKSTYNPIKWRGKINHKQGNSKENFADTRGNIKRVDDDLSGMKFPKSIIVFEKHSSQCGFHPTQKPVALLEYLIKTYTNENELILDNTMGSGTTGIACQNTNRKFIGIEKETNYFDIAVKRIKDNNNLFT